MDDLLWRKLLEKLRTDKTFLEGINGKPTSLPRAFMKSNYAFINLINVYLNNDILYKDILTFQDGGARPVEQLLEIYKKDLSKRLLNDETFVKETLKSKQLSEGSLLTLPVEFISATGGLKYAEWIIRSYISGGIQNFSDIATDVYRAILNYTVIIAKKSLKMQIEEKDINNYCGLVGCKAAFKDIPGLISVLEKYNKTSIPIYDGRDVKIYIPVTKEDACRYGQKTRWCTAAKDTMFFERYSTGPLYVIVPKKPTYKYEKYQFHNESGSYRNETDENIDMFKFMEKFPELTVKYETEHWYHYTLKYPVNSHTEVFIPKNKKRENEQYTLVYVNNVTKPYNYFIASEEMSSAEIVQATEGKKETKKISVLDFAIENLNFLDKLVYQDDEITLYGLNYNNDLQVLIAKNPSKYFKLPTKRRENMYLINYVDLTYTNSDNEFDGFKLFDLMRDFPNVLKLHVKLTDTLSVYRPRTVNFLNIDIFIIEGEALKEKTNFIAVQYNEADFHFSRSGLTNPGFLDKYPEILNLYKKIYEDSHVKIYTNDYQTFVKLAEKIYVFSKNIIPARRADLLTVNKLLSMYPHLKGLTPALIEANGESASFT